MSAIDIGSGFPRWQQLAALACLGLLLIIAPHPIELYLWHDIWPPLLVISEGIGIAVLSSAILGFTIERWLRADLSKDIFLTAIGHQFPPNFREALKSELVRLSQYKFLCEKHLLKIKIDPIDGECARVILAVERTVKNISFSDQEIYNLIHIDECNFSQESSSISECQMELVGSKKSPTYFTEIKKHPNKSISASTKKMKVRPGECARLNSRSKEIRRLSDEVSFFFTAPTINPTIEVEKPDNFQAEVFFGPDDDAQTIEEKYSSRVTLSGTYWPLQRMRIHWWPAS
jgi:hypothetical protein